MKIKNLIYFIIILLLSPAGIIAKEKNNFLNYLIRTPATIMDVGLIRLNSALVSLNSYDELDDATFDTSYIAPNIVVIALVFLRGDKEKKPVCDRSIKNLKKYLSKIGVISFFYTYGTPTNESGSQDYHLLGDNFLLVANIVDNKSRVLQCKSQLRNDLISYDTMD